MLITVKQLRRTISEVAASSRPKPNEMAQRLMTSSAINHAYNTASSSARPDDLAAAAADYAIETGLSSEERAKLGGRYMAQLVLALRAAATSHM